MSCSLTAEFNRFNGEHSAQHILHLSIPPTSSFTNLPSGFGLLFLPLFEEFGHHRFGAVALVQRPKVFGLQGHFVAFNGHTERERNRNLTISGTLNTSTLTSVITVNKRDIAYSAVCLTSFHCFLSLCGYCLFVMSRVVCFILWTKCDSKLKILREDSERILSAKTLNGVSWCWSSLSASESDLTGNWSSVCSGKRGDWLTEENKKRMVFSH